MEMVTTFDGTQAVRKDCRYIKGNYYIKNKQCIKIGDLWYRINSGRIIFDHEKQSWILKSDISTLISGVVDFEDDLPVLGYFSPNFYKNGELYYNGQKYTVIDRALLSKNSLLAEGLTEVYYYLGDPYVPKAYIQKVRPDKENTYVTFPFHYGSEKLIPEFSKTFEEQFIGDPLLSDYWRLLSPYTFGIEFETEKGTIPERHLKKNGLIACKDGSISGFEYVTIPLSGERGIQAIKRACELIEKFCLCSINESLHIHLGGYTRNVKNIASLYRLCCLVENEIFDLFPFYYRDTSNFKKKSYCGPLYKVGTDEITAPDIFSQVFVTLSGGREWTGRFPTGNHPMDRSGEHKWEISPRYYYANFIPMIWGDRGTVEFRCHPPTVKATKVIYWLFILVAILKYARKHNDILTSSRYAEITPITLNRILFEAYPKELANLIDKYCSIRKEYYKNKNDIIGEIEITSEVRSSVINPKPFI
jgi:hypothetical protein